LRKLEDLSELRGLRKDIWRIAVVLEKLAGIEGKDSNDRQIPWPESEREITEVQGCKEKEKQREERLDREEEEEEIGRQEEEKNEIEGINEGGSSFTPVMYSVST